MQSAASHPDPSSDERSPAPAQAEPGPALVPHPGLAAAAEYADWLESVCPCAESTELGRVVRDFLRGYPGRDAGAQRASRLLNAAAQITSFRARLEKPRPSEPNLLTIVRALEPQAAAALGWVAEELADHARQVGEGARAAADEAVALALSEEEGASADRLFALSLADTERDNARREAAAAQADADAADAPERDHEAARAGERPRRAADSSDDDSDGSSDSDSDGGARPAYPPLQVVRRGDMPPEDLLEDFDRGSGSP